MRKAYITVNCKEMEHLISVALCTYNGEEFIAKQLESILKQSYKNLEIVIIDDCSSDKTFSLLDVYAKQDSRIILKTNSTNLGFNANFEKAIKLCSGDFIAIADQDDIWKLDKIEILHQNIGTNWLIFSDSYFINDSGELIDGELMLKSFNLKNIDFRSLLFSNYLTGHTTLFSREILACLLPIPHSGYYDWWLGFIAVYHEKAVYLNQKLTYYRIHRNSVTFGSRLHGSSGKGRHKEMVKNLERIVKYKNLKPNDKISIDKLLIGLRRLNIYDKMLFFLQIYKNYTLFFPNLKFRSTLSRLNFARKFLIN